jgi:hypothetical protein
MQRFLPNAAKTQPQDPGFQASNIMHSKWRITWIHCISSKEKIDAPNLCLVTSLI